ncbi:MAG: DUF4431 domain-containing protein [Bacteroidota bacterium]
MKLLFTSILLCCSSIYFNGTTLKIKQQQNKAIDYYFEPKISSITGIIKLERFYGPPGFGENPKTDMIEDGYYLILSKAINVLSNEKVIEEGDFNTSKYNLDKVQLNPRNGIKLSAYKNKKVKITGTFYGAHSGHHHTDAILDVNAIEVVK